MLQHPHDPMTELPGEVRNVHLDKVRFGVFNAEGHLLGTFDTRDQADGLAWAGTGRHVHEVTDMIEVTLR